MIYRLQGCKKSAVIGWMAGMLLLAGCTQDKLADTSQGEILPEGKYPITFTATGLEVTPVTRATADGEWTKDDVVAVHLKSDKVDETKQYKPSATGSSTTTLDSKAPFYWQSTSDSYTVTAWSCFNGYSSTSPSMLEVKQNQSGDGYQKSDFLYAHGTLSYTEKDKSLTFYHQVAKVVVHVISGEDTPANMTITGITTGKLYIKRDPWTAPTKTDEFYGSGGSVSYSVNISPCAFNAGKVTPPGTAVQIDPLKSYKFLIVPQTVNSGDPLFTITADGYGAPFIYTPKENMSWAVGHEYTYYITIKGSVVTATVTNSIGWTGEDGTTGAGSVEI